MEQVMTGRACRRRGSRYEALGTGDCEIGDWGELELWRFAPPDFDGSHYTFCQSSAIHNFAVSSSSTCFIPAMSSNTMSLIAYLIKVFENQ